MRKAKYFATTEESYEIVTWHAWGQAAGDSYSYPVAIIEKNDGQVVMVEADRIQFCEPYISKEFLK